MNEGRLEVGSIFAALDRAGVEYILVGSLALAAHGYVRATRDVDVVPSPDRANLERLVAVLRQIDARLVGGELLPEVSLDVDSLAGGGNFPVETRHGRLDIMQDEPGIPSFEELAANAFPVALEGHEILVCSRDDLVAMKRAAGRDIDRLDLARLEVD